MYYDINCSIIKSCINADNDLQTPVWEDTLWFNIKWLILSIVTVAYIIGGRELYILLLMQRSLRLCSSILREKLEGFLHKLVEIRLLRQSPKEITP